MEKDEPLKTLSLFFGKELNISISFELMLNTLGFPCFSGLLKIMILRLKSMSVHFNLIASPDRIAVSFKT